VGFVGSALIKPTGPKPEEARKQADRESHVDQPKKI